ncbi:transporter [Amycolatopsis sp., V23-08]|uniref:Transporter n=1 Tax=Amycolatopsis heterodermiae TaxID=3110235 RepID=A0ABU5RAF1_9PSEU|nr:transporter [Amycolatopsis sp., V23-08]MEA5362825.1 transporter [Amycolatopsis sp., V23-08]
MTWLAWRQLRVPALAVYAALAVIGVILAITGPELVGRTNFSDQDVLYGGTILVLYLLPAAIGLFWGAPMITRELEHGTHSLVWNQTVTRRRWLTTKLAVGVPAAALAAGLLSLAVTWWASPIDTLSATATDGETLSRISPVVFAARGIVPIGYAVFAFVLGVAVGMVLRRTVAAMAVTLVALAAVLIAIPLFVRPYLLPAVQEDVTIANSSITNITGNGSGVETIGVASPPGVWLLANETVDPAGNAVSPLPDFVQSCMPRPGRDAGPPDPRGVNACMAQLDTHGYHQRLTYQPGSRFWPLQWLELALLLAVSALLTWFAYRRIRHLS